jgi:hypothetical protein
MKNTVHNDVVVIQRVEVGRDAVENFENLKGWWAKCQDRIIYYP